MEKEVECEMERINKEKFRKYQRGKGSARKTNQGTSEHCNGMSSGGLNGAGD